VKHSLSDKQHIPILNVNKALGVRITPAVLPHHRTYGSVSGGSSKNLSQLSHVEQRDQSKIVKKLLQEREIHCLSLVLKLGDNPIIPSLPFSIFLRRKITDFRNIGLLFPQTSRKEMVRECFMSAQARFFVFLYLILPGSSLCAQSQFSILPSEVITLYNSAQEAVPVITALDIDPGGQLLAMGGDNHLVRLWDVDAKRSRLEFREQLDWVRGIAFSDDHTHLIIVGQDGKMELRNLQTGSLVRKIQGKDHGMQAVAFRPGGKEFAVCGFPTTVSIYNASTGRMVRTLEAHGTSNRAIRYSPDGLLLAVAGRTGMIRIWNAETGEVAYELPGDGRRVNALAFNATSTRLAVGGDGPNITLWNMGNGKRSSVLPERPGKTFSLEFCGERLLASGESDNLIRFWDLELKSPVANTIGPDGHLGTIAALVYDSKKNTLISGSFDTTVRFWPVPK